MSLTWTPKPFVMSLTQDMFSLEGWTFFLSGGFNDRLETNDLKKCFNKGICSIIQDCKMNSLQNRSLMDRFTVKWVGNHQLPCCCERSEHLQGLSTSSIYKYQTFSFTRALCAFEKKQVRAGAVITLIVGLCCFFACCFLGLCVGWWPHLWDLLLCITALIWSAWQMIGQH